jgi:hypothetical protein
MLLSRRDLDAGDLRRIAAQVPAAATDVLAELGAYPVVGGFVGAGVTDPY